MPVMERYDFIDSLRGIAIIMVILVHSTLLVSNLEENWVSNLFYAGKNGVILFFIVSAFTMYLSIEKRKESISIFYTRRFFRIAPMFYIAIPLYLIVFGFGNRYWLGDQESITAVNITSHYLFLNGFNPYWINSIINVEWSIAVEMMFYIIVPFMFYWINNAKKAVMVTFVSLFFALGLQYVFILNPLISDEVLWGNYLSLYFPSQFPIFLMGICAFLVCKEKMKKAHGLILLVSSVTFLLTLTQINIPVIERYAFAFGFSGLLVSLFSIRPMIIVNRIWSYIGKVSYSAYIVHWAVIHYLKNTLPTFSSNIELQLIIGFLIVSVITILISIVTYITIEKPGIQLGRYVIRSIKTKMKQREIEVTQ
jgi:peptidoglycan/LPS O-acetylase OafA/YrhL